MSLTQEQLIRYSRHLVLPEVGVQGQEKLANARVLIAGAGGLGAPVILYLSACGVGALGVADFEKVDLTNLQRQVLYGTGDIGRPKTRATQERIGSLNPDVQAEFYPEKLTSKNALEILKGYDVIVDGTDTLSSRYLINDACVLLKKPLVHGSIYRFEGQATVFYPGKGPCYRCLFPEPPPPDAVPSCAEAGVFGVLPGLIGMIQATETIKLILGRGKPLIGRLLLYDALEMQFREVKFQRDSNCPVCGDNPTITKLIDYEAFCGVREEDGASVSRGVPEITVRELSERLKRHSPKIVILDVRGSAEYQISRLPGSRLVPLNELSRRLSELSKSDEIVACCLTGDRSSQAVRLLERSGFHNVRSLKGGIRAWADEVDPTMPRY